MSYGDPELTTTHACLTVAPACSGHVHDVVKSRRFPSGHLCRQCIVLLDGERRLIQRISASVL
jgi:hypothetical protein